MTYWDKQIKYDSEWRQRQPLHKFYASTTCKIANLKISSQDMENVGVGQFWLHFQKQSIKITVTQLSVWNIDGMNLEISHEMECTRNI